MTEPADTSPIARFNPDAKRICELALREALVLNHNWIGPEHLLLAILRDPDAKTVSALHALGRRPHT